ncbi:MAG: bifunctional biotin--[acetyl-CoA-carboxylase] ligase/biotin operon repressor BirA [Marinobacterium sp.]|nr:bifunctional biotin--[acetyl-CoA-carboxylase] ligase/biotin operon repressor BirA [Marinobacterium sp.]
MSSQQLLDILADGKFHSGSELGERIGVSRSAIWKQIRKLETLGLEIYSVKGRGYRLPGGLEKLDEQAIGAGLTDQVASQLHQLNLSLVTGSTNQLALDACQVGNAHGALFITEQQTAGRGRRGRTWVSPFGRNLYFSLVWRFESGAAAIEGLSLLVGLALARALENLPCVQPQLKWPNDLLCNGRKLAGILLEMAGDPAGDCQVVIGVGLNVNMSGSVLPVIDQPWTDLRQLTGEAVSRNELMACILNVLVPMLIQFSEHGFAPFRSAWENYHAYQRQPVQLVLGSRVESGACMGITDSGALRIANAQGEQQFHGGEVSLRPL